MRRSAKPRALAAILAGSWRKVPPLLEISPAEIEAICPSLVESGAGALAWWKLRHCALPPSLLEKLHASHVANAVHGAPHEQEIAAVCQLFRQAGIESILLKGWAVGRLYADSSLRPPGDIDLYVAPERKAVAENLLDREGFRELNVDLEHSEISRFGGSTFDEVLRRSCLADLNGCEVRVLGAEDHLRVLCLHLLKHGAWRPLWLCDIAAALESRSGSFDWKLCLGENKRHARWILCAAELARQVLDACADDLPSRAPLPYWLLPAVLRQWEEAPPDNVLLDLPLRRFFRHPQEAIGDLRRRWHNPIEVAIQADAEFNNVPKFPLQAADGLVRTFHFLARRLAN